MTRKAAEPSAKGGPDALARCLVEQLGVPAACRIAEANHWLGVLRSIEEDPMSQAELPRVGVRA